LETLGVTLFGFGRFSTIHPRRYGVQQKYKSTEEFSMLDNLRRPFIALLLF
jgi:hypothetical protein